MDGAPTRRLKCTLDDGDGQIPGVERAKARFTMTVSDVRALGGRTSEGFLVEKGSAIVVRLRQSAPAGIRANRGEDHAHLAPDGLLATDTIFTSPSSAAAFIAVGGSNGPTV